jgi:hypothetical protein
MENKFDKQVREKLKDVQLPFDEKAWQQMQQLLDGQKKQRISFYWWFGGIAILLLVGFGAYLLFETNNNTTGHAAQRSENAVSLETTQAMEQQKSAKIEDENSDLSNNMVVPDNKQHPITAAVTEPSIVSNTQEFLSTATLNDKAHTYSKPFPLRAFHTNKTAKTAASQTQKGNERFSYTEEDIKLLPSSAIEEGLHTTGALHGATESVIAITTDHKGNNLLTPDASMKDETENISHPISESQANIVEHADTISASDKREADIQSRPKKKRFHYSLGVISTATATIGRARSDKVSYFVGLTNDFLFFNRFALSAGVAYSQTHFTLVNPTSKYFEIPPREYSSFISEIIIPTSIKIYPVSGQHFRMYIFGGIIHHIKLKETFAYKKRKVDPAPNPNPNPNPNNPVTPTTSTFDFPTQTDFDGSDRVNEDSQINTLGGNTSGGRSASTADFSVNKANRYYTSINTGIGLEYVLKNKWIFFTEAIYLRSIQDIGVQDVKKHNLGAAGGMRIMF